MDLEYMQKMFEGSSKEFYSYEDGKYLMTFKDDIHGGGKQDNINGTGKLRKEFSYYFYRFLEQNNIKTHLCDDGLKEDGIIVKKVSSVKIEVLVRNVARGHWVDDHKFPIFPAGVVFKNPIVEFCLKIKTKLPDGRIIDDPRINDDLILALDEFAKDELGCKGKMLKTFEEIKNVRELAFKINEIFKNFLKEQGWILEDFKFEVGRDESGNIILIDEISPDCCRIRDQLGNSLSKDLFRQNKDAKEIYSGYEKLTKAIAEKIIN